MQSLECIKTTQLEKNRTVQEAKVWAALLIDAALIIGPDETGIVRWLKKEDKEQKEKK